MTDVFDAALTRPDVPMSDGGPDVPLPEDCGIYVSRMGNDGNSGVTADSPLQSIKVALENAAMDETPTVICVEQGDYSSALTIDSSVRLRGNFCEGFTSQSASCATQILSPEPWAVLVQGPGRPRVEIEAFNIETSNAVAPAGSTYGIRVIDSDLTLTSLSIVSGDGADGANGMREVAGARGDNGRDAQITGPGDGARNCGPGGDGAGVLPPRNGDDAPGSGGGFGAGGSVGSNGGDGQDGANAPDVTAAPGMGGAVIGSLSAEGRYRPGVGERGATGVAGFGGGGGGASNGNGVFANTRNGGGGGGGGCGGPGGQGGQGGGGSFGVVAISSSVVFVDVKIQLGDGGRGGDGSVGNDGGLGGSGGDGVFFGAGTRGGDGGDGGDAGPGGFGGGGMGGPSLGFVRNNSPDFTGTPEVSEGAGGAGGGGGGMGATGLTGPQQSLNLL